MGFYDLSKEERVKLVKEIEETITLDLKSGSSEGIQRYASDQDTYIRKNAYLNIGRLYRDQHDLRETILSVLENLFQAEDEKIRQTVVYAFGEVGKIDAEQIFGLLEVALNDEQPPVKRAVIGALKQMGEKNPIPTLAFAKQFLHHPDPSIRREIVHGIELRGRTHPEEILPLLAEVQNDPDKKVRETLIHVLAQISYKQGCLEKVISVLRDWDNKDVVKQAVREILEVHKRYEFSAKTYKEAMEYVENQLKK